MNSWATWPLKTGGDDGFHDRGIVQLLGFVDLIAAGDAAGVVVAEVLMVLLDRPDDIAFHDLHVVDVVRSLKRSEPTALQSSTPHAVWVAHIILVVDLAVKKLHADGHLVFLGEADDPFQTDGAILDALFHHSGLCGCRKSR